jgi:hypothetical protein
MERRNEKKEGRKRLENVLEEEKLNGGKESEGGRRG